MSRVRLPKGVFNKANWIAKLILPLPDFCQDIIYHRLLDKWLSDHPDVANAIIWETPSGPLKFASWPREKQDQLKQVFPFAYPFELTDPPVNRRTLNDGDYPGTFLSEEDAWKLYLNHVAQCLANDYWHAFPWTLEDLSDDDKSVMLDSRSYFSWSDTTNDYVIFAHISGRVLPASPARAYRFLRANNLIGETRFNTIALLLNWCRDNLVHFTGGNSALNMEYQWQYRGYPPVSRILDGTPNTNPETGYTDPTLKHRTAGCHGTNGFLRAILRVVNIPVLYQRPPGSGHATPVFSSEGRYLSHGDDPYSSLSKATPPFPAEELMIDQTQYDAWFPSGAADPNVNIGRRPLELAITYLPDYILQKHCYDLSVGASHADSLVYGIFSRVYSVAELEAENLWTRMDDKIAARGGCENI